MAEDQMERKKKLTYCAGCRRSRRFTRGQCPACPRRLRLRRPHETALDQRRAHEDGWIVSRTV